MSDKYEIVLMFDIELDGGTKYVATQDFYYSGQKYRGCVVPGSFSIYERSPDLFYGIRSNVEFNFDMEDVDDGVNDTWPVTMASEDFRGRYVKVQSYNETDGLQFIAYSKINAVRRSSDGIFSVSTGSSDSVLETILPRHVVTASTFATTAMDTGMPVNICFGKCFDVPLPNICNDRANDYYDYLIGYGTTQGLIEDAANNWGVKRDGRLVSTSEYTFYDGSQVAPYPGYSFIRFIKEQEDFSPGKYYKLTADVNGLELGGATADRNFINCISNLLSDATFGLDQSVDAATFAVAAAVILPANGFYCDGAVTKQQAVSSILNDMLMPSRAFLYRGSDKEWEISIDGTSASVLNAGCNDGHYNNFIVESLETIPADQMISIVKVHYGLKNRALDENELAYNVIENTIDADVGSERIFECPFVYEVDTAKKVVSYVTRYMTLSNTLVSGKGDLEWRNIARGSVITLTAPGFNISAVEYLVCEIRYNFQGDYGVKLRPYDSDLYADIVLVSPTNPTASNTVVIGPKSIIGQVNLGDGGALPGQLTLNIAGTYGDTYVRAGKTDFTNVDAGFILGIDDSDSDRVKAYIGDSTNYFNWTGTALVIETASLKINTGTGTFTWLGDLDVGSIPGFPSHNVCYLDVPMTEAYGTVLHDESRLRVNGTMSGPPVWTTGGPLGSYLAFTAASNHYVDFGDNGNWDYVAPGYDMSWSFWFYVTGAPVGSSHTLMSKGEVDVAGWFIGLNVNGTMRLVINKSGDSTICPTAAEVPYNQWNHIAFVYDFAAADTGIVYVYLNGELNNTITDVVTIADASAYNLYLGKRGGATPYYFDGRLSAFKFFHYLALTEDNVKALYKYPQGIRGGQVTARSVFVGTPSGSAPGTKIDDTGIWAYGAAGAQLFGFCTISSGSVTWNSQSLSAGHFVLGDYNGASGILYNGNFSLKVSASDTITMSGGTFSVTAGTVAFSATSALNISASTHTWSGGTINITGTTVNVSTGTFNITAGTHTWSGGTITMSGGSLGITGGTIEIGASGAFTMTAGTFSISGGTVSISASSGLTIAAGSKITINSTNGIYLGAVGQLYYDASAVILTSGSGDVSLIAGDDVLITASGGETIIDSVVLRPNMANVGSWGTASYYPGDLYVGEVNYRTIDEYPWDDADDLALIRAIQPRRNADGSLWRNKDGKLAYDVKTFPRTLTNLDNLHEVISEKYNIGGIGITAQDIDEILDEKKEIILPDGPVIDREEISKHLFTKGPRMSGFQLSVHRRIVAEIDAQAGELAALRSEIAALKQARLN